MATTAERLRRIEKLATRLARLDEEPVPPEVADVPYAHWHGVARGLGAEIALEVHQLQQALRRPAKNGR